MVIDTSAVTAILRDEPDAKAFADAIWDAPTRSMSAVSVLEAGIVAERSKGGPGVQRLNVLLREAEIQIVPFDAEQAMAAIEGFRRFGKGNHPAGLNFGDCAAYSLARVSGEPLLFKGDDFARTDVAAVP